MAHNTTALTRLAHSRDRPHRPAPFDENTRERGREVEGGALRGAGGDGRELGGMGKR